MSNTALRPVAGPISPAILAVTGAPSRRELPEVTPAFRIIPSLSPLVGDIGVLAETYARAAERAEAARRQATRQP